MSQDLSVFETKERRELRAILAREPVATAYLLGDLAEPFFGHTRWFVGAYQGRPEAVVLVYTGLSAPVVLSYGAPDAVSAVFDAHPEVLGSPCYAKIPLEHEPAYSAHWRIEGSERLWVMGLTQDEFRPAIASDVEQLTPATSLPELEALYADYPGNFFEPSQLAIGVYYGLRSAGALVAVAGTHVFAPGEGVAVLGNIVTSARARRRGFGRACTSAIVSALFREGCRVIALQVAADNGPAIALYRTLGFRFHSVILQSHCLPTVGNPIG